MTHIPPEDQRITREQAYALAQLHAEMMMTLEAAGWPFGAEYDIWVDTRTLSRKERRARRDAQRELGERGTVEKTEKVIISEYAIPSAGFFFTRDGAVYQETLVGSPSGVMESDQEELLAFAYLGETWEVENAMHAIIDECAKRMSENATT